MPQPLALNPPLGRGERMDHLWFAVSHWLLAHPQTVGFLLIVCVLMMVVAAT